MIAVLLLIALLQCVVATDQTIRQTAQLSFYVNKTLLYSAHPDTNHQKLLCWTIADLYRVMDLSYEELSLLTVQDEEDEKLRFKVGFVYKWPKGDPNYDWGTGMAWCQQINKQFQSHWANEFGRSYDRHLYVLHHAIFDEQYKPVYSMYDVTFDHCLHCNNTTPTSPETTASQCSQPVRAIYASSVYDKSCADCSFIQSLPARAVPPSPSGPGIDGSSSKSSLSTGLTIFYSLIFILCMFGCYKFYQYRRKNATFTDLRDSAEEPTFKSKALSFCKFLCAPCFNWWEHKDFQAVRSEQDDFEMNSVFDEDFDEDLEEVALQ